jgi:hypothetical protein
MSASDDRLKGWIEKAGIPHKSLAIRCCTYYLPFYVTVGRSNREIAFNILGFFLCTYHQVLPFLFFPFLML